MADTAPTEHEAEQLSVDPAELLTAGGVAKCLKISIRQARKLNAEGLMPKCIRVGRSVRWRRAEIVAWVAGGCQSREVWEKRAESERTGG